jgi:uncharacterized membrane protein (UPF0127 family)
MTSEKLIKIAKNGEKPILLDSVRLCRSRLCRLIGLQFHRRLHPGEGLLLAYEQDSIIASSIHMFFVFFPIAAIWINSQRIVTHRILALPWHPFYASPTPACYVLETHPELLRQIEVGDQLEFIENYQCH